MAKASKPSKIERLVRASPKPKGPALPSNTRAAKMVSQFGSMAAYSHLLVKAGVLSEHRQARLPQYKSKVRYTRPGKPDPTLTSKGKAPTLDSMLADDMTATRPAVARGSKVAAKRQAAANRKANPPASPLERAWRAWKAAGERDSALKYGGTALHRFVAEAKKAGVDFNEANRDFEAQHPRQPAGSPGGIGGEFKQKTTVEVIVTADGKRIFRKKAL